LVGGRLEVVELNGEEVASWRVNWFDQDLPMASGRRWVPGSNFRCTDAAYAAIGGFAERAIVHYRYRRDPRAAVRQMCRAWAIWCVDGTGLIDFSV
jgi:hypothetical protein